VVSSFAAKARISIHNHRLPRQEQMADRYAGFRLARETMKMIPKNESGVVVLFAQMAESNGFEIVEVQTGFPDAVIRKDGVEYRAEFEYKALNFLLHGHDPRECDLIICWQNDFQDSIIPVICLSDDNWSQTDLTQLSDPTRRELAYWKQRAVLSERKLEIFQKEQMEVNCKRISADEEINLKRSDADFMFIIDALPEKGLSWLSWNNTKLPSGRILKDYKQFKPVLEQLCRCGAIVDRRPGASGSLVATPEEIKLRLSILANR
jgi:hypothetical protein